MHLRRLAHLLLLACSGACGSDDASDGATAAGTTGTTSSTGSTTAAASSTGGSLDAESGQDTSAAGSSDTSSGAGSSDTGPSIDCAGLGCAADEVCIEDRFAPSCTNLDNPDAMCPDGQTKTKCGGIGTPCCCDPPPPVEHRCASADGCGDAPPSCGCLGMPCAAGSGCYEPVTPDAPFVCEPLPAP